jgi:hypothetical protein
MFGRSRMLQDTEVHYPEYRFSPIVAESILHYRKGTVSEEGNHESKGEQEKEEGRFQPGTQRR